VALAIRPKVYSLPSYSLTGDLIAFLRCGLQYRYTRIGRLPPSHPVQLWFGEFIHGVLEEAYRRYRDSVIKGQSAPFPWSVAEVDDVRKLIKARLAARGLYAWDEDLEDLGDRRAEAAIQDLGPHLFPIIHRAEVRLYGARMLPPIDPRLQFREADRYEIVGIVDVITHVELNAPAFQVNPVVQLLLTALKGKPTGKFEVLFDYKGMRRPPSFGAAKASLWEQYAWQVQTYAELRRKQPDALPVIAGVLLYINELLPTQTDMERLKRELRAGLTDVAPSPGSVTETMLRAWTPGMPVPLLPLEFRLARALRVMPVTRQAIDEALASFDTVVEQIETCRGREINGSRVIEAWDRNSDDESSCVVCDSRTFCPDFQKKYAKQRSETLPRLPGVRKKRS
jgi:hypothetical protein